jgi:hypothetical protein
MCNDQKEYFNEMMIGFDKVVNKIDSEGCDVKNFIIGKTKDLENYFSKAIEQNQNYILSKILTLENYDIKLMGLINEKFDANDNKLSEYRISIIEGTESVANVINLKINEILTKIDLSREYRTI